MKLAWCRALVALLLATGLADPASARAADDQAWRIEHGPDGLPAELLPRRYVDYPVAYALYQLSGVAAMCADAVPDVKLAADVLSDALLVAAGYTPDERASTMAAFAAQLNGAPTVSDAAACRAELAKAEKPARDFIDGKLR